MTTGVIYLLRFVSPFKRARHLEQRLADHRNGNGARLMFWVVRARTWAGGRQRERQLKTQGGHSRHCPVCRPPRRPRSCHL